VPRRKSQTAVPAKGDLVLIHGQVDHLSLKNTSPITRHTFQLHLVEGPSQGITWSAQNWLQLSDNRPFMPLALSL
jgi:phytanoyl-CoA hydroxylase